jgi:hypothetical protein
MRFSARLDIAFVYLPADPRQSLCKTSNPRTAALPGSRSITLQTYHILRSRMVVPATPSRDLFPEEAYIVRRPMGMYDLTAALIMIERLLWRIMIEGVHLLDPEAGKN